MNKFLFFFLLFFVKSILAQSPQQISYQGVARNASGILLSNTTIAVKFDIHQGSAAGSVVFTEQQQGGTGLTTNSFGLFTTSIGSVNNLNVINWSNGPFFMEVSIDPLNGTAYHSVGIQQLMSVPYALYAEKAGNTTPTPTISINAPNTISNPSAGTYSITIPSSPAYSSGAGISITGGIISNTASNQTVTIAGAGASTVTGTYPNFTIHSPTVASVVTPTITGTGATSVTGTYPSLTINTPTTQLYIAGTGIDVTGGIITNIATDKTVTITGTGASTVTGVYPNFTINSPTMVAAVTPTITGAGATSVTGTYPSLTINTPTTQVYTAGNGIDITGGVITNTLSSITTTITGFGLAAVSSPSTNVYHVTVPTSTLTVTGNSISINPGNTQVLPTYSLTAGNPNLTLNQTGNNYTITPVTPTLNVSGGSLSGAYPSQTLTIPSSSTTLVQGNNITLNQAGNTYTVSSITPTLTAGPNVTITPLGASNVYTITAGTTSYTGTANNISVSGNTLNLIPTAVTTGTYGASATNAVPTFSVDNFGRLTAASQYTLAISGDITGSVNTSTVSKLRGVSVSSVVPTTNQVLQYNGVSWIPSTLSADWSLVGNAGTTASNFIGTTDNNGFYLKTNNLERANFTVANNLNLFMGDNVNSGALNLNGNIPNSIKVLEAATITNGSALKIMAGDSKTGSSNATGGILSLVSGASTGNVGSTIDFFTASPGGSGSTRSNPDLKMRLTESGQLLIGSTTGYSANSKLVIADGHIESLQTTGPSIVALPLLVTASLGSTSTDVVGTVTITTPLSGLLSSGNYAKITFNKTYGSTPIVILTPTNANAAGIGMYITGTTLTDFTIAFSQSAALLSSYTFNYIVLEGK